VKQSLTRKFNNTEDQTVREASLADKRFREHDQRMQSINKRLLAKAKKSRSREQSMLAMRKKFTRDDKAGEHKLIPTAGRTKANWKQLAVEIKQVSARKKTLREMRITRKTFLWKRLRRLEAIADSNVRPIFDTNPVALVGGQVVADYEALNHAYISGDLIGKALRGFRKSYGVPHRLVSRHLQKIPREVIAAFNLEVDIQSLGEWCHSPENIKHEVLLRCACIIEMWLNLLDKPTVAYTDEDVKALFEDITYLCRQVGRDARLSDQPLEYAEDTWYAENGYVDVSKTS
jgi:hypothetical protein